MSKEKDRIELEGSSVTRKSGRVVFDKRGRGSWEWQTATGVFETEVSHEQLRGLEAAHLTVVDAQPVEGRVWENPMERSRGGSATKHDSSQRQTGEPHKLANTKTS